MGINDDTCIPLEATRKLQHFGVINMAGSITSIMSWFPHRNHKDKMDVLCFFPVSSMSERIHVLISDISGHHVSIRSLGTHITASSCIEAGGNAQELREKVGPISTSADGNLVPVPPVVPPYCELPWYWALFIIIHNNTAA